MTPDPLNPHEKNRCAYFSNRTCDDCRANWAVRVPLQNNVLAVYCIRMASDLMQAEADRLKTVIDMERIEKLIRFALEKLEENDPQKIGKKNFIS